MKVALDFGDFEKIHMWVWRDFVDQIVVVLDFGDLDFLEAMRERKDEIFFVAFPPFLLYFFAGAFLFAFDDDICLFFSGSHRSNN